jgi:hypothetical protein
MASTLIVDQLQKTGGSTTALTLPTSNASANEFLQNNGAGALSWASASAGFSDVHSDITHGSEVYTVPTGITKLLVIITGGGGSGSSGISATANGGGGCSAGTVMARVTVVPTDTITIAVGAGGANTANVTNTVGNVGGDSTFTHTSGTGSFDTITAPGGRAGVLYNTATADPIAPTVGASNAGIAIKGGTSVDQGAASFWGQGGMQGLPSITTSKVGAAFGSGGGGGTYTAGLFYGSAGCDGVCFIMEFK